MYEVGKFIVIILSTIIPFLWVFRLKVFNSKIYYGALVFFFFIYSGIGGAIKGVYYNYWLYYMVYAMTLSLGIILAKGNKVAISELKLQVRINTFLDKYANKIIIVFIALNLLRLVYPEFLLYRLVYPPLPNLRDVFAARFEESTITTYQAFLYYLIEFLKPFFFFALYKHRKSPLLLFFILFSIPYISYCNASYIARGSMILYTFIYFVTIWKYNERLRKVLFIILLILTPTIVLFLVNYSSIRLGNDAVVEGSALAIIKIFISETSFPLWFTRLVENPFNIRNTFEYLYWIITLPIPGFIKGPVEIGTYEISEILHGISPSEPGFYVLLPGVVGESIFYFGKYFFWIHSLFMGFIIGKVLYLLNRSDFFSVLLFYSAFTFSYIINRGGTGAAYPFALKHFLIFYIVIYIYSRYKIKFNAKVFK